MTAREVLRSFGINASAIRPLSRSARNWHWVARGGDGDLVLTRISGARSLDDARYQSRVMRRFRDRGWPVPEIVCEPAVVDGRVWMVSRRLPGRSRAPRSEASAAREQRERGRMIARFHADAWEVADVGQRPGFLRADEMPSLRPTHEEAFAAWESRLPDEVGLLRWHWERARELMRDLRADALPPLAIHGDFAPWNLLYAGGRLTGLLDFEFSHLELRVGEFALSWRGKNDEVVRGYMDEVPLDERETALITPVRWAWLCDGARWTLLNTGDEAPDLSWTMPQLVRRTPLMASSL